MYMYRFVCIFSVLIFVSGCATFVSSKISVFHSLPDTPVSTKYAFSPLDNQKGSLEYENYKNMVKNELLAYQYVEAPITEAKVLVVFGYGIDGGKVEVSSKPVYGQTGVSSATTSGNVSVYGNYGSYSESTTYTPTYGVVGSKIESKTVYTRRMWLNILDKTSIEDGNFKKIYEANVVSKGSTGQIAVIMPYLVTSIFRRFPGESGSVRNESIEMK